MELDDATIREYLEGKRDMDVSTMGVLGQMKQEATENFQKSKQCKRDRYDFAFNELVKRHVEQQRRMGVAVPSHREASMAAQLVMERILQEDNK